jgi:hypothetical protein
MIQRTLLLSTAIALASPCFAQFGAGVKASTLGIGFEAAAALTARSNIRGGVNAFGYDHDLTKNGIDYDGKLRLRSVQLNYDWFAGHGFHLSPGVLLYNGNRLEATASVPGGRSFTIGDTRYFSDPANPIAGTAKVDFGKNKVAPMILVGFGDLVRRSGRRFSVNVEGGIVFMGSPSAHLNFTSNTCTFAGLSCESVTTNPEFQSNVRKEEEKINNGVAPYDGMQTISKYYPIVSIGFGFRFR